MEKTQEDNKKIFIQMSKTNIDNSLIVDKYKNAFIQLILVLERLDNNEKFEIIDDYSKNLYKFTRDFNPLEDMSLYKKVFLL